MSDNDIIEIRHNDQYYCVDKLKIIYVLSKLTNKNNSKSSDAKIIELMKKFHLIDKDFLTNINKL